MSLQDAIRRTRPGSPDDITGFVKLYIQQAIAAEVAALKGTITDEVRAAIKAAAEDKLLKNLKGDKGDSVVGPRGVPGTNGADGKNGKDGRSIEGPPGRDGLSIQGPAGKDGSPDTPDQVVDKVITSKKKIPRSKIDGLDDALIQIQRTAREKGASVTKKGGGMGNVTHQATSTSSATTSVATTNRIAGNGFALWVYYNGALLSRGVQYTVGTDQKTISFTFTLDDSSTVDIIYIRT